MKTLVNKKIWLKIINPVLASFFIFLVTAEITLRFVKPLPSFCKIDIFSYGAEYLLSPNQKLIYVPKPNFGEWNSYGHRGAEFPFKKTAKKRILVIGDSVVEGLGVSIHDRFTDKLGNALGSQFEVINLGVRGYSLLQEFEYFKLLGTKFSPDIVLWGITYNDLVLHSGEVDNLNRLMQTMKNGPFYKEYYRVKNQMDKIMMRSYFYSCIRYVGTVLSKKTFKETVYYELRINETQDLLTQLREFSKKDNFRLIFVFLPVNTPLYADKMQFLAALMKSEGLESVDLNEYLGHRDKNRFFFSKDPCHLNPKGHLKVAHALHAIIESG